MDIFNHSLSWRLGWCLILLGFASGALLGLQFHRSEFLGGYGSFRRRIIRLGHVALPALGIINVLYGLSPQPRTPSWETAAASLCFAIGGVTMPAVCFLTAWKEPVRYLFFIPVTALLVAVGCVLKGGLP